MSSNQLGQIVSNGIGFPRDPNKAYFRFRQSNSKITLFIPKLFAVIIASPNAKASAANWEKNFRKLEPTARRWPELSLNTIDGDPEPDDLKKDGSTLNLVHPNEGGFQVAFF